MKEASLVLHAVELMHKIQSPGMIAAVGHHMGVQEYLDEHLTPEEKEIIESLSPRKKREWLASRSLLFALSGEPQRMGCVYDDFGKPILRGSDKHISISHSELWCSAMISDRPCGVDIQIYSYTVKRIAERFLTEDEIKVAFATKHALSYLHLLWGAKECMYKAYGKRKLGFREHIHVGAFNPVSGTGQGEIRYEGLHLHYELYYRMLPEVAWVFCCERPVSSPAAG